MLQVRHAIHRPNLLLCSLFEQIFRCGYGLNLAHWRKYGARGEKMTAAYLVFLITAAITTYNEKVNKKPGKNTARQEEGNLEPSPVPRSHGFLRLTIDSDRRRLKVLY